MSKPRAINFPFVKVPHDRNPALWSVSVFARGLALELFIASCTGGERGYDPAPIPVYGNWKTSLCRLLQVDSLDRGNTARILMRLEAVGVLEVEGDFVHVRYHAPKYSDPGPPAVRPESGAGPVPVPLSSGASPVGVRTDLTPGNDSTPVRQKEEIDKKEEREYARPREGDLESDVKVGNDFMFNATGLHWQMCDHELQLLGAKPLAERTKALDAMRRDAWCKSNRTKCSPKHVLRKWNDYAAGAPPMQLAKNETSDSQTWRSRVQQSTQKLEDLHDRRSKLQRSDVNYASTLYDIDKAIREETERLERRKRELHALTG